VNVGPSRISRDPLAKIAKLPNSDLKVRIRNSDSNLWFFLAVLAIFARAIPDLGEPDLQRPN
jgi:hypothetical protein